MANTNDEAEWDTGVPEHLTTSPQSGLHLAPQALMARIQEALTTSSRTEAALADLSRTAQFLCATVSAVCRTNAELARELEALRGMLEDNGATTIDLCASSLDQPDEFGPYEGDGNETLQRQQLIADHDRFIAMLVADHERELEALRQHLAEAHP
jgi:hypothetical protein